MNSKPVRAPGTQSTLSRLRTLSVYTHSDTQEDAPSFTQLALSFPSEQSAYRKIFYDFFLIVQYINALPFCPFMVKLTVVCARTCAHTHTHTRHIFFVSRSWPPRAPLWEQGHAGASRTQGSHFSAYTPRSEATASDTVPFFTV